MVGAAMNPPAAGLLSSPNMGNIQQQKQIASLVNSYRLSTVADRMAAHILPTGRESNANEFFNLCLSLARGIDYSVAHNEVPARAHELPILLTQICQRRNDLFLQSAIMVLMLSVKNACKAGWFSEKENQELIALANEMGSSFSGHRNLNTGPSNLVSTISTIMTRFYPQMKMGQILVSLEIEPGYGAFMIDFQLSKNVRHSPQEKIQLFVAQTDNIETSACIISPQEANFLLNGKPVDRRTNALMDPGPQLPTTVNKLLKFGTNLLQAVGLFNGHYVAVVAFMSMEPSLNSPVIQDYVQSGIAVQDSDSDIIEGPSRISLNCPISYKRITTPVKGHSCKHLQCFDFENFVDINSRRPSWRCPHCNQHVCYTDIRVDQNMVKVLREVGKDVADVIICADGSWKAVMESDDNMDVAHDKIEKEGLEQQESTGLSNSGLVVLDLTKDDDEMDALSTDETEDQKPLLTNLQSQPVAANITMSSESNATVGVNQNVLSQTEDDFWSGLLYSNGSALSTSRMDAQFVGGISEPTSNFMTSSVLADAMTDAFSHALNREAEACGYTNLTTSVMQSQYSAPNNLLLQQLQLANNQEYGRLPLNRHVSRTPIAVQALPAPSQTPSPQQRSVTSLGFMTPNGSSLPPQAAVSVANSYSDVERQQQFSRPPVNAFLGPDIASASLQHHSAAQVVGLPPTSTLPGAYRVSTGLSTENQNIYQQQALNLRMPQSRNQSSVVIPSSSPLARTPTQQGSAAVGVGHTAGNVSSQHARAMVASHRAARTATHITRQPPTVPVQVQTSRTGPSYQANAEGVWASAGEQRVNIAGQPQGVMPDNFTDLPSEHNWRPGRMRGSLTGRAYSAALSQLMIQPTQPTQAGRPLTNPISSLPTVPPHLQVPLANRRNAHLPQVQNNPITERGSVNGGSGILPERSSGMN